MTRAMRMPRSLQVHVIRRRLTSRGISPDTVDVEAEVDSTLHLDENIEQMSRYFPTQPGDEPDYEAMEDDWLKQLYEEIYPPGEAAYYPPELPDALVAAWMQIDPLLEDTEARERWMDENMERMRCELVLKALEELNKVWRARTARDLDHVLTSLKKEGYNAETQFSRAWEAVPYFESKRLDYETIVVLLPPGSDPAASVVWRIPRRS